MAVLKSKEVRDMPPEERKKKLRELRTELIHEKGVAAMGGAPASPGKIKTLRISITRILTIMREEGEI